METTLPFPPDHPRWSDRPPVPFPPAGPLITDRPLVLGEITCASIVALQCSCDP